MAKDNQESLVLQEISPIRVMVITAITVAVIVGLSLSPWREELVNRFSRPFEFQTRNLLGKDPKLDERIRVYSIGDSTLFYLNNTDLMIKEWGQVFQRLKDRGASAIFVDKLFGTPLGPKQIDAFQKIMDNIGIPIVTGAYTTKRPIRDRPTINLSSEAYQLDQLYKSPAERKSVFWQEDSPRFGYGPGLLVMNIFKHLGHIEYLGRNYVYPFRKIDEKTVLPSAALMMLKDRTIENGRLKVNGKQVFVDSQKRILVNIGHPEQYSKNLFALKSVIRSIRAKKSVRKFDTQDTHVVVLPAMFTGNADMKPTPFGLLPGGYIMTALINSALTGNWLRVSEFQVLLPIVFALLGSFLAINLGAIPFLLSIGLGVVSIAGIGILSFSYFGYVLPWLFCSIGFFLGGITIFAEKFRITELGQQKLAKDIDLGSWAQTLFLPDRWEEQLDDTKYKIVFEPFGPMSGDWVQICSSENAVVLAIGDVVGKGPSAALNTAVIASVWSRHKDNWNDGLPDIESFVVDLNNTIYSLFKGKQFTTLSIAILMKDEIELFCFGAPSWLLVSKNGKIKPVALPPRDPIGLSDREPKVKSRNLSLVGGQILVGYSDGVIDGPGARRRLANMLSKMNDNFSFDELEQKMRSAGEADRLPDDFTLLMIETADAGDGKNSLDDGREAS